MGKQNTIECEACGCRVPMVRSVRMRVDPEKEFDRIKNKFQGLDVIPEHLQDEFFRAHVQYYRNSQHRRAFICLECYAALDKHYGIAAIPTGDLLCGPVHEQAREAEIKSPAGHLRRSI